MYEKSGTETEKEIGPKMTMLGMIFTLSVSWSLS